MTKPVECPACRRAGAESCDGPVGTLEKCIRCKHCGDYIVGQQVYGWLSDRNEHRLPEPIRRKLERWLYETREEGERSVTAEALADGDGVGRRMDLESLARLYEDDGSPLEKYENTIRRIASHGKAFGHGFDFPRQDRWVVPTMDDDEAYSILLALRNEDYLAGTAGVDRIFVFTLTPLGLRYAGELGRQARSESESVFVAACFNTELKDARNTICEIVDGLGYKARIVNQEPHNDLVDLKIYERIRESRFVVADLTCNRQSVYYEVGFAHGLGLEVVLTCRSDHLKNARNDFKRVHFDLNHRNILVWKDTTELAEKLRGHIYQSFGAQALIG